MQGIRGMEEEVRESTQKQEKAIAHARQLTGRNKQLEKSSRQLTATNQSLQEEGVKANGKLGVANERVRVAVEARSASDVENRRLKRKLRNSTSLPDAQIAEIKRK